MGRLCVYLVSCGVHGVRWVCIVATCAAHTRYGRHTLMCSTLWQELRSETLDIKRLYLSVLPWWLAAAVGSPGEGLWWLRRVVQGLGVSPDP